MDRTTHASHLRAGERLDPVPVDEPIPNRPVRVAGYVLAAGALAVIITVLSAPLTLPWIVAAWVATILVVGTAIVLNR